MISSSIKIWSRRKRMGSDVDNGGRLDYVITYSCSVIPYLRRDRTRNRNGPAARETCKTRLGGFISIPFQSEASQLRCFLMEFMLLYQAEWSTDKIGFPNIIKLDTNLKPIRTEYFLHIFGVDVERSSLRRSFRRLIYTGIYASYRKLISIEMCNIHSSVHKPAGFGK